MGTASPLEIVLFLCLLGATAVALWVCIRARQRVEAVRYIGGAVAMVADDWFRARMNILGWKLFALGLTTIALFAPPPQHRGIVEWVTLLRVFAIGMVFAAFYDAWRTWQSERALDGQKEQRAIESIEKTDA